MGAEPKGYPRTLLVDADSQHGGWVVEQLNRAGFKTDLASGWPAGHGLLGFGSVYPACIVIADLEQPKHLEEVGKLRRLRPSVWFMVLSHRPIDRALPLARAHGVDAVLAEPFSMQDLTSRLTAFSVRARPLF